MNGRVHNAGRHTQKKGRINKSPSKWVRSWPHGEHGKPTWGTKKGNEDICKGTTELPLGLRPSKSPPERSTRPVLSITLLLFALRLMAFCGVGSLILHVSHHRSLVAIHSHHSNSLDVRCQASYFVYPIWCFRCGERALTFAGAGTSFRVLVWPKIRSDLCAAIVADTGCCRNFEDQTFVVGGF